VRLLQKKPQAALEDFLECGRRQEAVGAVNPSVIAWRSGAALACAALGDALAARRLLEEELRPAQAFGAPGTLGRVLRALGAVERGGASLEALEEAVRVLEKSQAALERARGLVDYGATLRRSNRRRDAREPLRAGLDLAERCGSALLASRAAAELAAAGGSPPDRPERNRLPHSARAAGRRVSRRGAVEPGDRGGALRNGEDC
jgi:hypothetical protein